MRATTIKVRAAALLAAAACGAVALLWTADRGKAIQDVSDKPAAFGLVGLVSDQTLRLNAVNIGVAPRSGQARPCQVRLGFADIDGGSIIDPGIKTLRPGQGAFVDLDARGILDPGSRGQVRPVALRGPDTRSCRVVFTAEVIDPGSRTAVHISDPGI